ncbi:MAG: SDR family NAD(P)-dependent oxidoreductase [Candidatus Limnocylindrales bacterium]
MGARLQGKVAIVTGAAGYLGMSHCVHLAREGAKVVVTDIVDGQKTVDAVQEAGGEAIFRKVDVTSWEDAQRMAADTIAAYGRIDILVNNAALVANIHDPPIVIPAARLRCTGRRSHGPAGSAGGPRGS